MPKLRELRLPYSVDDGGAQYLLPLKGRLRRLDVSESQITADGVAALPDCYVESLSDP